MPSNRVYYESILDGGDNHATNKRKKLHNDKTPPQERTQEHAQLDTGYHQRENESRIPDDRPIDLHVARSFHRYSSQPFLPTSHQPPVQELNSLPTTSSEPQSNTGSEMSDDIQDAAAISDPNDSSYDPSASENGNGEEPTAVAAARAPSPNSEPRSNATDGTEGNMDDEGVSDTEHSHAQQPWSGVLMGHARNTVQTSIRAFFKPAGKDED